MRRGYAALLFVLGALIFAANPIAAAPKVQVQPSPKGVRLLVEGKLIAAFRTPNGSLSAEGRAKLAADRLRAILSGDGVSAEAVEVRDRGDDCGVYVDGILVMIATAAEARERDESPRTTAARWASNLKSAIPASRSVPARVAAGKGKRKGGKAPAGRKPTLAADDNNVTVPLEETRVVELRGTAEGPLSVRTEGDAALATPIAGRAAIEVRGVGLGSTVVRVERGGVETGFTVWVKKYAGKVVRTSEAAVTGSIAPASLVRKVAIPQALEGIEREPGTTVKIVGGAEGVRALGRGESTEVVFPIAIEGEGLLTNRTEARVKVNNLVLPAQEVGTLLYSNDPESVREYGTLYEGMVDHRAPVRLLYHHQNRMGRAFAFQIHLTNPGSAPVDVQVIEADAGPYIDPLQVGHRAVHRYLGLVSADIGYVLRVPARSSRQVYMSRLPHLDTVSGIYNFRVISGGSLVAQVRAMAESSTPELRSDLLEVAGEEPHTYADPTKSITSEYVVGERWAFIQMGKTPITGRTANRKLLGNYGVLYSIDVEISNPTDEEKTVRIMMTPDSGTARGAFMIDGKLIESPQLDPPLEAVLWSAKLAPKQQRKVTIQGMPAGGSNYPVSLVVRS